MEGSWCDSRLDGRRQQAGRRGKNLGEPPKAAPDSLQERYTRQSVEKRVTEAENITAQMIACIEASASSCAGSTYNFGSSQNAEVALRKLSQSFENLQSKAFQQSSSREEHMPLKSSASIQAVLDLIAQRNARLQAISDAKQKTEPSRSVQIAENREFVAERKIADANRARSEQIREIREYEDRLAAIEKAREEHADQFAKAKAASEDKKSEHRAAMLQAFPEHLQQYTSPAKEEHIASEVNEARRAETMAMQELENSSERKEKELKAMLAHELRRWDECKQHAVERIARSESLEKNAKEDIRKDLENQTARLMQQMANAENAMHENSDYLQVELSRQLELVEEQISETEHSERFEIERIIEEEQVHSREFECMLTEAEQVLSEINSTTASAQNETRIARHELAEAQEEAVSQKEAAFNACEADLSKLKDKLNQQLQSAEIEIASINLEMQSQQRLADSAISSERASVEDRAEELVAQALAFMQTEVAELDFAKETLAESEERANLEESLAYELSTSVKMDAVAPLKCLQREVEAANQEEATILEKLRSEENRLLASAAEQISALVRISSDKAESSQLGRHSEMERAEAEIESFEVESRKAQALGHEAEEQFEHLTKSLEACKESLQLEEHRLAEDTSEKLAAIESSEMSLVEQLRAKRDEACDQEAALQIEERQRIEVYELSLQEYRQVREQSAEIAAEEMANAFESERDVEEEVAEKYHYLNLWEIHEVDAAEVDAQKKIGHEMESFNAFMERISELVRNERSEQEAHIQNARIFSAERQEALQAESASLLEVSAHSRKAEEFLRASREVHEEQELAAHMNEEKIANVRGVEEEEVALAQAEMAEDERATEEMMNTFALRCARAEERQADAESRKATIESTLLADLEKIEVERRQRGEAAVEREEDIKQTLVSYLERNRVAEENTLMGLERHATTPVGGRKDSRSDGATSVLSANDINDPSLPGWSSLSDSAKKSRYRASCEEQEAQQSAEVDRR